MVYCNTFFFSIIPDSKRQQTTNPFGIHFQTPNKNSSEFYGWTDCWRNCTWKTRKTLCSIQYWTDGNKESRKQLTRLICVQICLQLMFFVFWCYLLPFRVVTLYVLNVPERHCKITTFPWTRKKIDYFSFSAKIQQPCYARTFNPPPFGHPLSKGEGRASMAAALCGAVLIVL